MDSDYLTPAFLNKQVVKRGGGRGAWITIISPLCSLTNKWSGGNIAWPPRGDPHVIRGDPHNPWVAHNPWTPRNHDSLKRTNGFEQRGNEQLLPSSIKLQRDTPGKSVAIAWETRRHEKVTPRPARLRESDSKANAKLYMSQQKYTRVTKTLPRRHALN